MDALEQHKQEDWRFVHKIWENIRALLSRYVRSYAGISLDLDGAWKTVTVAAGATVVILQFDWIGDAGTDTAWVYTRKYGESSSYEGIMLGQGRCGGTIVQDLDSSGRFEYKGQLMSGTAHLVKLGYYKFPLS
jgi:hypothetical protein